VLAWVGADGMNTINTKITTGTWWGYKVTHWTDRSEMGVSVAWGNNKWVLMYAGVDEDYATRGRLLYYKWSYDGLHGMDHIMSLGVGAFRIQLTALLAHQFSHSIVLAEGLFYCL
jgi:hypothetical protein